MSDLIAQHIHSTAMFEAVLFAISVFAGFLGSILGLGGGIIIVPALTLLIGVNIRYAVGASIVSVIATSCGATALFIRGRITNIRIAILLEVATTTGALTGSVLATRMHSDHLYSIFSGMLIISAFLMLRRSRVEVRVSTSVSKISQYLRVNNSYFDPSIGKSIFYVVNRIPLGLTLMFAAGILSGLLGIGSGALKVPAMDSAMGLPIKVSSATSNFMIGVTAAASAGIYYVGGAILPIIAAPVALGVLVGSILGSKIMLHMKGKQIRIIFIVIILIISIQMLLKGLGGSYVD